MQFWIMCENMVISFFNLSHLIISHYILIVLQIAHSIDNFIHFGISQIHDFEENDIVLFVFLPFLQFS